MVGRNQPRKLNMRQGKIGENGVGEWVKTQNAIFVAKEAPKYVSSNDNDAPSITKCGFLVRFAFRSTASWGAQSHNAVISNHFVFHQVPNPRTSVVPTTGTSSVTLWLCVIVCLAAMHGTA